MIQLFDENPEKLLPAIVQDDITKTVLMLGYMNKKAYQKTIESKKVTFYSRSRKEIWVKGETSGNYLELIDIKIDCDKDTLLVKAIPQGPTCHKGTDSCWGEKNHPVKTDILNELEDLIEERIKEKSKNSYIFTLFEKGINKIAQKVGEESIELIIEAKDNNKELFLNEAADLLFHFLILLKAKKTDLKQVHTILEKRRKSLK